MPQQLLSLLTVSPLQENWDASLESVVASLRGALRTFNLSIQVQGSVSSDSVVLIQLQDAVGNNLSEQVYVRVRVTDVAGGLYLNAANATISVITGTIVETKTSGKDFTVQSNSSGQITIDCHDTTAETFTLLIGPAAMCPPFANFNNSIGVTHA